MIKECNLVEFFSGIGSQAKALKNLGIKVNTVGTCEWDVHAIAAYDMIHNSPEIPDDISAMEKEELLEKLAPYTFSNSGKAALDTASFRTYSREVLQHIYASITRNHNFVDISGLSGDKLSGDIDILTYSFPCQDLSNVGAFHGYNKGIDKDSGSRSSLLWQVGRILTEMKAADTSLPRFLVMENVPTLLSQRHKQNFDTWIRDLEGLGYVSKYYELNALSFGLPQNRPRLLMISVYVGDDNSLKDLVDEYFRLKTKEDVVDDYVASDFYHNYEIGDLLRTRYENKKLRAEAVDCTPNDTPSRRKIWEDNPQIILPDYVPNEEITFIRTITTKQDRNPNSGNLYFDSGIEGRSKFRYLTPRECLLFMGFTDDDYKVLKKNNLEFHKGDSLFARDKIIRMAGNSIPVKLLEGIFLQVSMLHDLINDYQIRKDKFGDNSDNKEGYCKLIRSGLFAKGIRSRVNNEDYPHEADIAYQKYRTAVFIGDCFWHTHDCPDAGNPENNLDIWGYLRDREQGLLMGRINSALNMGWNVLLIWECALCEDRLESTLDWISSSLKKNVKSAKARGQLLTHG